MRSRPIHLATLRDFCFLSVCAGIAVMTATAILWLYATYFAPREKQRRLAEEGTFFLRTYASVHTEHGIIGMSAGERVQRVHARTLPGMMRVTDGEHQFDVFPYQLTDDLDVADALSASDSEAQRLLAERAASDLWAVQTEQSRHNLAHANDVARVSSQWKNASVVGALLTPLNTGVTRQIGRSTFALPVFYSTPVQSSGSSSTASTTTASPAPAPAPTAPASPAPVRYLDDPQTRLRRTAVASPSSVSANQGW